MIAEDAARPGTQESLRDNGVVTASALPAGGRLITERGANELMPSPEGKAINHRHRHAQQKGTPMDQYGRGLARTAAGDATGSIHPVTPVTGHPRSSRAVSEAAAPRRVSRR